MSYKTPKFLCNTSDELLSIISTTTCHLNAKVLINNDQNLIKYNYCTKEMLFSSKYSAQSKYFPTKGAVIESISS